MASEATWGTDHVGERPCSVIRDHLRARGKLRITSRLVLSRQSCYPTAARDAPDVVISADRIVLAGSGVVATTSGLAGPDRTARSDGPTLAVGGHGGDGGDLVLRAEVVVLEGRIRLGDGGPGGDGGRSGRLRIEADRVVGEPTIRGGRGGDGGAALAIGAGQSSNASGDRDRRDQGENGTDYTDPDGGNASARALNGSTGRLDGQDGGNATAIGGDGADGIEQGGRGGNATAIAGDGGSGRNVEETDRDAGQGGDGGKAKARGGQGGFGRLGGHGGDARALGGDGGPGGDALGNGTGSASRQVQAGPGGWGGIAGAFGGRGAPGDAQGGDGGSAFARSGDGGDGGDAPGRHGQGGEGGYGGQLVSATGEEGGPGSAGDGASGNATAVVGDGGDGGNGTAEAGLGGYPGEADIMPNGSRSTVVDGEIGRNGSLLPTPETSTQESLPLRPGTAVLALVLAALAAAARDD